jgi:hypothetical protein
MLWKHVFASTCVSHTIACRYIDSCRHRHGRCQRKDADQLERVQMWLLKCSLEVGACIRKGIPLLTDEEAEDLHEIPHALSCHTSCGCSHAVVTLQHTQRSVSLLTFASATSLSSFALSMMVRFRLVKACCCRLASCRRCAVCQSDFASTLQRLLHLLYQSADVMPFVGHCTFELPSVPRRLRLPQGAAAVLASVSGGEQNVNASQGVLSGSPAVSSPAVRNAGCSMALPLPS